MNQHEIVIEINPQPVRKPMISEATLKTIGEAIVIGVAFYKLFRFIGIMDGRHQRKSKGKK